MSSRPATLPALRAPCTRGNGFVSVFASDLLLPQGECTAVRPLIAVSEKTEPPLWTLSKSRRNVFLAS
jgi:hypothetical protein